ncbi:DUF2087 domain-containing protein [Actinopolymorpha pittospori]
MPSTPSREARARDLASLRRRPNADAARSRAAQCLAALSDSERLAVLSWIVLNADRAGSTLLTDCAAALRLDIDVVRDAVSRLVAVHLLRREGGTLAVDVEVIRKVVAQLDENTTGERLAREFPRTAGLFSHGRLVRLPETRPVQAELSAALATLFEFGRAYAETDVDEVVRAVHDDHASLRRLLVDHGHLTRERSVYVRTEPASEPR